MTRFRVLPFRRGDAYLLMSARGDYLVDGGAHGQDLPELLSDRRVRKLRAAICTSACAERLGGILELLEADSNVLEYWLPEELDRITEAARRFNGDRETWHCLANGEETEALPLDVRSKKEATTPASWRILGAATLIELGMSACFGDGFVINSTEQGKPCQPGEVAGYFNRVLTYLSDRAGRRWRENGTPMEKIIRQVGARLLDGGGPEDMALLCGRLLFAEAERLPGGDERGMRAVIQGLALAAMTAALLSRTEAKVRAFRNVGKLVRTLVPRHPILCLNGVPSDPLEGLPAVTSPQLIMQLARRISGHRYGLVFQYGDAECGALFCSDTRLSFLDRAENIVLDRPTVITAPRQGTCSSERTYGFIVSPNPEKDIWVRSHYSNARKISVFYKNQPNKVCLNNCRDLTLQEILIEHADGHWRCVAGGGCACG